MVNRTDRGSNFMEFTFVRGVGEKMRRDDKHLNKQMVKIMIGSL